MNTKEIEPKTIKSLMDYADRRQLTVDEMENMISCMSADKAKESDRKSMIEALEQATTHGLIKGRNPKNACPFLIAFLATLCDSPGRCVQWAHTINKMGEGADLSTFANTFPMGIPTEDAMLRAWDDQKISLNGRGCNGLDQEYAWDLPEERA